MPATRLLCLKFSPELPRRETPLEQENSTEVLGGSLWLTRGFKQSPGQEGGPEQRVTGGNKHRVSGSG